MVCWSHAFFTIINPVLFTSVGVTIRSVLSSSSSSTSSTSTSLKDYPSKDDSTCTDPFSCFGFMFGI